MSTFSRAAALAALTGVVAVAALAQSGPEAGPRRGADGRLASVELEAMARAARAERMAARLDADGDGFVSREELAARGQGLVARLGPNGVLTRDEALAGGGFGRMGGGRQGGGRLGGDCD